MTAEVFSPEAGIRMTHGAGPTFPGNPKSVGRLEPVPVLSGEHREPNVGRDSKRIAEEPHRIRETTLQVQGAVLRAEGVERRWLAHRGREAEFPNGLEPPIVLSCGVARRQTYECHSENNS